MSKSNIPQEVNDQIEQGAKNMLASPKVSEIINRPVFSEIREGIEAAMEACYIVGGYDGYSLASQQTSEIKAENERLRGMVKEQFIQMFKTAGVSNLGKIDEYWQQFKTENNL